MEDHGDFIAYDVHSKMNEKEFLALGTGNCP